MTLYSLTHYVLSEPCTDVQICFFSNSRTYQSDKSLHEKDQIPQGTLDTLCTNRTDFASVAVDNRGGCAHYCLSVALRGRTMNPHAAHLTVAQGRLRWSQGGAEGGDRSGGGG